MKKLKRHVIFSTHRKIRFVPPTTSSFRARTLCPLKSSNNLRDASSVDPSVAKLLRAKIAFTAVFDYSLNTCSERVSVECIVSCPPFDPVTSPTPIAFQTRLETRRESYDRENPRAWERAFFLFAPLEKKGWILSPLWVSVNLLVIFFHSRHSETRY